MAQQVAYSLQRYSGIQQTGGSRESECVSSVAPLDFDAGLFESALNDGM
jgi:hypothetical protein